MTLLSEMAAILALGMGGSAILANLVPATRIPWTPDETGAGGGAANDATRCSGAPDTSPPKQPCNQRLPRKP